MAEKLYCLIYHTRGANWKNFEVVPLRVYRDGGQRFELPLFFTFAELEASASEWLSRTKKKRIPALRPGSTISWNIVHSNGAQSIMAVDPENCEFYQQLKRVDALKEESLAVQEEIEKLELYQRLVQLKSEIANCQKNVKGALTRTV